MKLLKKHIAVIAIIVVVLFISVLSSGLFGQISGSNASFGNGEFVTKSTNDSVLAIAPESASSYTELGMTDQVISQSEENATEQYIIKTGSLEMVVNDIDETTSQLVNLAQVFGGTVTNRYIYSYDQAKSGTVELTVDQADFETAINAIKELGTRIISENVNADDVTETVVDIQARLENKQAEEQAYLDILQKATKVEDILNIQYYLSMVRGEIESYQASLEYYENHTNQASIIVYLTEATSIILDSDTFQPWQTVKDSVQTVVRLFQGLVLSVIQIIVVGGAILIPVAIIYFGGRLIYRKYKK
ncbi:MAG: DUF4349 domain-containing protein [Patescibacteria group bacterium]